MPVIKVRRSKIQKLIIINLLVISIAEMNAGKMITERVMAPVTEIYMFASPAWHSR